MLASIFFFWSSLHCFAFIVSARHPLSLFLFPFSVFQTPLTHTHRRTPTDITAAYVIGILFFSITLVPWTADTQSLLARAGGVLVRCCAERYLMLMLSRYCCLL
jgi:hypothetical protein